MELVSHELIAKGRDSDPILLMPVGDIQWIGDSKEVALKMLKKHIAWGVEQGAYFIGMGDYIDSFSPSNRQRLRGAALYDTALKGIDGMAQNLVEELLEEALAPSRGRWLGLLEGHHFHEFRDGETSDQYLSRALDAPFLGTSAYVRLVFRRGKSGTARGRVLIWAHHGAGGGTLQGAPLNKLEHIVKSFEADIYLMGHQTKKPAVALDRVEPVFSGNGEPRLIHRTKLLVGTGGFMKGYVEGARQGSIPRGGYVEQKMLNPTALGGPLIRIRPRWKQTGDGEVWLPDLSVEV